ncbi:aminoacyl-histidine dipeptidase [Aeromonas schubertii]|uniref:Aminoacyl-histidine dipeptidase n=1 Tax=Aeromonas schubertii TaxID=652 RepID=A0ABS7VBG4_9GAMM|nr:aminoacyl-histidine dipeptidase [Aeromonas schubertii]KUE79460.1 aminoacyl-histidine dipeptidase [Aeromonas schubertii]MBZ6066731.1 aminoacyl-histidine dipeptidase [Aeromonas schubertii]MBZ6072226.1 aminoacyl-histidine dipeptidase [Aeromonas schubertii]
MAQLSSLSPTLVWHFFEKICSIPHPSKHEQALASWITEWANAEGLAVKQDKVGNLFIKKPATPGMENRKPVVLQAHLDMVPQANADTPHDFTKDPIDAYVDGEWVTARGTTLGADNGIGMAACLAVLADKSLKHGPLEVLLTSDEETGMTGAFGLEAGWLEGEILINTDSEEDGEVYMGCAGGVDANIRFPLELIAAPAGEAFELQVKGLVGGHSGGDIHRGRGNANKLLVRLLKAAQDLNVELAEIHGGTLRNAIPREARATLIVPGASVNAFKALVDRFTGIYQSELAATEPNLTLLLTQTTAPAKVMSTALRDRLLDALMACPNGVMRMSDSMAGVVETSTNLGVIKTLDGEVYIQCLIRSLIDSGRDQIEQMTRSLFALAGASCEFTGAYPGWAPNVNSPVMELVRGAYQELFGSRPNIMVIHAGLECGLFKSAYPEWDMVSFGPTIRGAHSPDERVHIVAVERFWQLLSRVLEQIPAK